MVTTLKSNDNLLSEKVSLPLPPEDKNAHSEMEIYARFMRHLRLVPNESLEIKILSAIQFTADMIDIGDALVAKTLVDLGLRAPRKAFPSEYLNFINNSLLRTGWEVGGPTKSAAELKLHWDKIGEDQYASFRSRASAPSSSLFVETFTEEVV